MTSHIIWHGYLTSLKAKNKIIIRFYIGILKIHCAKHHKEKECKSK